MISIISPTYNRAHLLPGMVNSLINQTHKNWELLIVDDGSSDNTEELLLDFMKADTRIKFYKRPESRLKGANACRNIGIENAKGDYVVFLDSDDQIPVEFLAQRMEAIKDKQFDILITTQSEEPIDFNKGFLINKSDQLHYLKTYLSFKFLWKITDLVWKREIIKELKFDESLKRFQDVDLHIRALMKDDLRIIVIHNLIGFTREKDEFKYHNKDFIIRVLDSYNDLYFKFNPVLSKVLKRSLIKSNANFIRFLINLKKLDKEEFKYRKREFIFNNNFPLKSRAIFITTLLVENSGRIIPIILKDKIIFKLTSYC